jgi:hypothetical protein
MSESQEMIEVLDRRVKRREDRREFFKAALGVAAVGAGGFAFASAAQAQAVTDADIFNFALNLEYLEANFYSYAVNGTPIDAAITTGMGTNGYAASAVSSAGARAVTFTDPVVRQYAREIAVDEIAHVRFLRTTLGAAAVAQPQIDVGTSPNGAFSNAARAAGLVGPGVAFDAYASDEAFLLGAFVFEDVGVTAYKGASPLISNPVFLEAAAGILEVEAYHAAIVRTVLFSKGLAQPAAAPLQLIAATEAISTARDSLDGSSDLDQGVAPIGNQSNIVPTDSNGLAFSRSAGQVLNIVFLNRAAVTLGGFFPAGVNGPIRTSAAN